MNKDIKKMKKNIVNIIDTNNNKNTYISLFSSAGIGCYGFKKENFQCLATNEFLSKRIEIQKNNKVCVNDEGYILGDIREKKDKILDIVKKHTKQITVIIATPPCQGISTLNQKKNDKEILRNSLVVESINLIKKIKPKFFILENVGAFLKTECINAKNQTITIEQLLEEELSPQYNFYSKVINFKNYGSNSSRRRTLIIGVEHSITEHITPLELFPDFTEEKPLSCVLQKMKPLEWGEFDDDDFYHQFRIYPKHMREWIKDLKPGQSAFENDEIHKKPHRIINNQIVINKNSLGKKYSRAYWDKTALCIHTRSDCMASQHTIHPFEDRVFSIREIMKMMTIPKDFRWIDSDLSDLNKLTLLEKNKLFKKHEINIRQSIGESVPTIIFQQIARKINIFLNKKILNISEIKTEIKNYNLYIFENLKKYIIEKKHYIHETCLSIIVELANNKRNQNAAFFTNKFLIEEIIKKLPLFNNKKKISIIEPSVGAGNFLPYIFKKYAEKEKVDLTLVEIDPDMVEILKIIYDKTSIPKNFNLKFICQDFLKLEHEKVDLIIGNPPFNKSKNKEQKNILKKFKTPTNNNLASFFLEKSLNQARYVSLIMPKNFLSAPIYDKIREQIKIQSILDIIDFGNKGFYGVSLETINFMIDNKKINSKINIYDFVHKINLIQKCNYICDEKLPYWVIYRDSFFDQIYKQMHFDIFEIFRDRQITNTYLIKVNEKEIENKEYIRILRSRNISEDGKKIQNIKNYDTYMHHKYINKFDIIKKINQKNDVYMVPNMSYKTRIIKRDLEQLANGSIAFLIPKSKEIKLDKEDMEYIAHQEFRNFYQIARNKQKLTLNIDKNSVFWFGKKINIGELESDISI